MIRLFTDTLDKDFKSIDVNLLDSFKNKTVLVTGCTGLIGSIFTKFMLYANENYGLNIRIIVLVRNISKFNDIYGLYSNRITTYKCDLSLDELVIGEPIDFILHAAAITTSKTMITSPVDVISTSINGTAKILKLATEKHAKLVFLSSMEVYGSISQDTKAKESDLGYINLESIRSCYPESKRLCEVLCRAYSHQYGTQVIIARLSQVFGAGVLQTENRVFAQFCRSAIKNQDIILKTQGLSEGNYTYSTDAISAFFILFNKGLSGETYNVSNEATHCTIKELAELVSNVIAHGKSNVCIDVDEDNTNGYADDVKLFLNSAKIRKLGWTPQVNLDEAFIRLASYMRETNQ